MCFASYIRYLTGSNLDSESTCDFSLCYLIDNEIQGTMDTNHNVLHIAYDLPWSKLNSSSVLWEA